MGQRYQRRADRSLVLLSPLAQAWWRAVLTGVVAGFALSPLGWMPLLWACLALFWGLLERPQPRLTTACGAGLTVMISHRWLLALHPLDWIGVPLPLSLPLCWLLLGLCGVLAAGLVAAWSSMALWLQPERFSSALVLSCSWGLGEVLLARGPLFWIGLGGAALPGDPPLAALASFGGAGLVAALQLLIGWMVWRLFAHAPARLRGRMGAWLSALLALLLVHGVGLLQLASLASLAEPPAEALRERVVVLQPAIPTREKFQWQSRQRLDRLLQRTLDEAMAARADLVVLPEGALGLEPELPQPSPVELVSGGFRWQSRQGAEPEQRSALLRFPAGAQRASGALDKHRLVPLGEWVPMASLLRWSGLSAVGGLQPGPSSRLLIRPAGSVAAAICYEIADGTSLAAAVNQGGGWLMASANLDPYPPLLQHQFTALARLRAMESGRWLLSVANTGPSQLIDPAGRLVQQLKPGVPATLIATVPVLSEATLYVQIREMGLLAVLLMALGWRGRRRICSGTANGSPGLR